MIVLVCGGRHYGEVTTPRGAGKAALEAARAVAKAQRDRVNSVLDGIHKDIDGADVQPTTDLTRLANITMILQGEATGADKVALAWAYLNRVPAPRKYKADWKRLGNSAGPRRNERMLTEGKPDLVVAFPGGTGTADMVSRALRAGVPVTIVP